MTTIFKAIKNNDLTGLLECLSRSPRLNIKAPLVQAIQYGCSSELILALISAGADVEETNHADISPLVAACNKCNFSVVSLLLDYGANPMTLNSSGIPCLNLAVQSGPRIVNALVAHGADPNYLPENGPTSLDVAYHGGYHDAAVALMDSGATVELAQAANGRNSEQAREWFCDIAPIVVATMVGDLERLKALLDRGVSPDTRRRMGTASQPLLTLAVETVNANTVDLLLSRGATVDLPNEAGLTSLLIAARRGSLPIVSLLLEYGADATREWRPGYDSLVAAVSGNRVDIVEQLVRHAELHRLSLSHTEAIKLARNRGLVEIARLLEGNQSEL